MSGSLAAATGALAGGIQVGTAADLARLDGVGPGASKQLIDNLADDALNGG